MTMHDEQQVDQQVDWDRCGWGTEWGCGEFLNLGDDAALVLNAAEPEGVFDNGHRLFHSACLPAEARPTHESRRRLAAALSAGGANRSLRAV